MLYLGARTVKWTTHDPYLNSSESDSNLYTNFEFCEEKIPWHSKDILIYKAKQFMMTKTIPKKILHILEEVACVVQVGDIEQATV